MYNFAETLLTLFWTLNYNFILYLSKQHFLSWSISWIFFVHSYNGIIGSKWLNEVIYSVYSYHLFFLFIGSLLKIKPNKPSIESLLYNILCLIVLAMIQRNEFKNNFKYLLFFSFRFFKAIVLEVVCQPFQLI